MTPKQADKLIAAWQNYSDEGIKAMIADAINMDVRDALNARADVLEADAEALVTEHGNTRFVALVPDFRERARVLRAMADRLAEAEG